MQIGTHGDWNFLEAKSGSAGLKNIAGEERDAFSQMTLLAGKNNWSFDGNSLPMCSDQILKEFSAASVPWLSASQAHLAFREVRYRGRNFIA
jgi:hypothetical protein